MMEMNSEDVYAEVEKCIMVGDFKEAEYQLNRLLRYFPREENLPQKCKGYRLLTYTCLMLSDTLKSERYLKIAESIAEDANLLNEIYKIQYCQALFYFQNLRDEEADTLLHRILESISAEDDPHLYSQIMRLLGMISVRRRYGDIAHEYYTQALEYISETDLYLQALTYFDLSVIDYFRENYEDAYTYGNQALKLWIELNNEWMIAKTSHQMSLYAKKLDKLDEALGHIDKSIGYKRMHRDIIGMGKSYYLKALIQKELNNISDSVRCFQMGLSIFTKMDMKEDIEFGEQQLQELSVPIELEEI